MISSNSSSVELIKILTPLSSASYHDVITSDEGPTPMFDFLYSLLGFTQRKSWRYGARWNPADLDNGAFGMENPNPETARQDYFSENSPSAERDRKQRNQSGNEQF